MSTDSFKSTSNSWVHLCNNDSLLSHFNTHHPALISDQQFAI